MTAKLRVAIVGGGLAGLVVALRRADAGDDVQLFEERARFGGQLHSEVTDGLVVEHGAEGFVARSTAIPAIAERAGVGHALVDQLRDVSFGFDGTTLTRLERGEAARFLGFQVHGDDLGRGIRSFAEGMEQLPRGLVSTLAGAARATLRTSTPIERIERTGNTWRLETNQAQQEADVVVIASSAASAARLLAPTFGEAAARLRRATTLSSVTVTLAYEQEALLHALDGTGFVVKTEVQQEGFRACTFVSSKLPGRAPAGIALLRLFFRPEPQDLEALSDAGWVARAERQLERAIKSRGSPMRAWVSRWANALPVSDEAHLARVSEVEGELVREQLWLAGSAFHGSGIDAAVRSAERTAAAIG